MYQAEVRREGKARRLPEDVELGDDVFAFPAAGNDGVASIQPFSSSSDHTYAPHVFAARITLAEKLAPYTNALTFVCRCFWGAIGDPGRSDVSANHLLSF